MKSRILPATTLAAALAALAAGAIVAAQTQSQPESSGDSFKFRVGVQLVNVTATVTDSSGRYVPNLTKSDFSVYEDGVLQNVTHFSNQRVPVSLGILLDTSGSMAGEKMDRAQEALNRFLFTLTEPVDEIFLYQFSGTPVLVESFTTDRNRLSRSLGRVQAHGGTALYDAVSEGVELAQTGQNRKKAVLIISDGNDTNSRASLDEARQAIRRSEVMVYAVGIDGTGPDGGVTWGGRIPIPLPFPFPGGGRRRGPIGIPQPQPNNPADYRVNRDALRALTDDSGGRTEIVRAARDIDPATSSVAYELSQQYSLAYAPPEASHDGRWHTIRVDVRNPSLHVRARRGYMASFDQKSSGK